MQPLSAAEIKGNWATVVLPINSDDSIDWARLEAELDFILDAEVDGVYTNGTAGEFLTQTESEFVRLSQTVAEKCEKRNVAFQIGASHASPQTMLERARVAAELRSSAVQVVLPDWVALNDEEILVFLERIAKTIAPIGTVLYNPPHAKRVLAPSELGNLQKRIPQLVGIKVMDGDDDWYRAMREHCANLSVFVPGHRLAGGFRRGAAGAYSNVACLHPRAAQKWWELMHGDSDTAARIEAQLQNFFRLHIAPLKTKRGYSAAALDKLLAAIGGWASIGTRLRFPYRSISEAEVDTFRLAALRLVPDLFHLSTK